MGGTACLVDRDEGQGKWVMARRSNENPKQHVRGRHRQRNRYQCHEDHGEKAEEQQISRVHESFQSATEQPVRLPQIFRPHSFQVPCPVRASGKRKSRASVASTMAGPLTLHDASTNKSFLIDTGAEVSVVPATEQDRQGALLKRELVAANGSRIRCYGEKKLRLHVKARTYEWKFLVADVKRALIGADFLMHSSPLVDLRNCQLVHPEELNSTPLQRTKHRSRITGLAFDASANPSPLAKLFAEFPAVTVPNFKIDRPRHAVHHTIEIRGQPVRAKARPLPPQKLAAARANFAGMATSGIVRRSNGPWSSPLHIVT